MHSGNSECEWHRRSCLLGSDGLRAIPRKRLRPAIGPGRFRSTQTCLGMLISRGPETETPECGEHESGNCENLDRQYHILSESQLTRFVLVIRSMNTLLFACILFALLLSGYFVIDSHLCDLLR